MVIKTHNQDGQRMQSAADFTLDVTKSNCPVVIFHLGGGGGREGRRGRQITQREEIRGVGGRAKK